MAAEQTVEHGRGQAGVLGGFSDADRHGIILDQEADCGCKFQVRDGDHIGACASDDGGGADHDGFNRNFLIFEHFLHGFGEFKSDGAVFSADIGKGDRGIFCIEGAVGIAEDGEFLGDAVSCLHEGAVGGDDDVMGSQDKGGRAWQFLNEFGEGSEHFLIIVIFCSARKAVMGIEIEVAFGGKLLKCGCWGDGDAADIAGECADGEGCDVLKALSLKEVEGEPGHFTGIAEDGADISAGGKIS